MQRALARSRRPVPRRRAQVGPARAMPAPRDVRRRRQRVRQMATHQTPARRPREMRSRRRRLRRGGRPATAGRSEVSNAVVELLLGDEPQEQRHAGHRPGSEQARERGDRHAPTKPAEPGHITRARLVIDRARDEKERALVAGVGEQIGQAGDDGRARADAEQQHQHAQRADRGVRQDALEIGFEHRSVRAAQHRQRRQRA